MSRNDEWVLWGSRLSPFALKVSLLCDFAGLRHRWLPAEGSFREGVRFDARRRALARGRLALSWPPITELDELPLVPFLFGPDGENLYDSSAIGHWLDGRSPDGSALVPVAPPALRFAVRLVDEALDEVGRYLVHHNRWVVSARDNGAGRRLAREYRPVLGPLAPVLGRWFAARQVRRLPYLFSVAPEAAGDAALPRRLRSPGRPGFPPTHALLEEAFGRLLAAVEPVLRESAFLFGERFTLADASLFGQLAMNRSDPSADAWIRRDAPAVHGWLARLEQRDFSASRPDGRLEPDARLEPLFAWIGDVFVPLMQQNRDAFERHRAAGETRFNEAAFDLGCSLYDGELLGRPFRAVAKSFQVRVWRDLEREWGELSDEARATLFDVLPRANERVADVARPEVEP